jgi:hypothetical protein
MICPRPKTHDPNPTAVPIREAIKETFRVFITYLAPRLRVIIFAVPDAFQ